MTIIQLNNAQAAAALHAHLQAQGDLSVEEVAPDRLRVSLLGSYHQDAMRLELLLRIRAWQAAEHARGNTVTAQLADS